MFLCEDHWKFRRFSIISKFWNKFPEKLKLFSKILGNVFWLKLLQLKLTHQKSLLRQIEWGVQDGPTTKDGVLPVTTLFFLKCSSPTVYQPHNQLCTNYRNLHVLNLLKRYSFIWWYLFPVSILKWFLEN